MPPFTNTFQWGVELYRFVLARGTPRWLSLFPLGTIICGIVYWFLLEHLLIVVLGFVLLITVVVLSLFFRDPERIIGDGVVSPADGKVVRIECRGRDWWFVSIFMNVHNVHVNRIPWTGTILDQEYIKGGFAPAFNKESDRNERLITRLKTRYGKWELVQIAGAVARRIVPYVQTGQELNKGERFGLIRLGSRVDLLFKMPRGMTIDIEVGQKVRAGSTNIASPTKTKHRGGR
jgi:phosphatidylserine decarboxylase precursor-related protein